MRLSHAFPFGGFVDADDGSAHRIYFEEYGPKNAPATIMVHGNAGYIFDPQRIHQWDTQRQRIIYVHARGVGRSVSANDLEANLYPNLAEDIETVRKHLVIDRIGLFGWSGGAGPCLLYAQKYSHRCDDVTLYGAFLGTQNEVYEYYERSVEKYPHGWKKFCDHYGSPTVHAAVRAYNREMTTGSAEARTAAALRYERVFGDIDISPEDQQKLVRNRTIYAHMMKNNFGVTAGSYADLSGVHLSFVHGTKDYIASLDVARSLASIVYQVEGAGHDVHGPEAQKALKAILSPVPSSPPRPRPAP